eukprot:m51a1_g4514 hypothetical protein (194) ;mRNA; r:409834-410415
MVAASAAAASRAGLASRCAFVAGDARALPLPDSSADFVLARLVLQHTARPEDAVREMARVARDGGVVCALDGDARSDVVEPEPRGRAALERALGEMARARGGDRDVGAKLLGVFARAGVAGARARQLAVTAQEMGREQFARVMYGWYEAALRRDARDTPELLEAAGAVADAVAHDEATFASAAIFGAWAVVHK